MFELTRKRLVLGVAALLAATGLPQWSMATTIIGGLGNFDVHNDTDDECDEFDIELEGVHVEDVYHTYHNGNYGPPTITALPGNVGIRVVYDTPYHNTQRGAIEHFGVSLRDLSRVTAQRFQWKTVVRIPPPPIPVPTISVELLYPPTGPLIRETVTNVDTYGRAVWVIRSKTRANREVALEELMPNDPLIQGSNQVDLEAERLMPGQSLIEEDDAPPPGELASYVFTYEVYKDFFGMQGDLITTVLTASIAAGSSCPPQYLPVFTMQPQDTTAALDGAAFFEIAAAGPVEYGEIFYQWKHEGVDMPGEDNPLLGIDPVLPAHAGTYECVVRNDCGVVASQVATLTIPPCVGDLDADVQVTLSDLARMLAHFGAENGASPDEGDLDGDHDVDLSDLTLLLSNFGVHC
ncbi:MAG: hypothetical protein HZB38_10060 [Planctomycetes bacterium]|nr:hypothetical protein [Planctomycetota bacterium]